MGQFGSLFKKNSLVWRRDTCCCICQIVTVIVFAIIMAMIKQLSKSSEVTKDNTLYLANPKAPFGDVPFPMPQMGSIASDDDVVNAFATFAVQPMARFIKDCNYMVDPASMRKGGYVALLTKNDQMFNNLDKFFKKLNFATKRITSKIEMDQAIQQDTYGSRLLPSGVSDTVCFGITFEEEANGKYAYNLHFNSTGRPTTLDIPDSRAEQEIPFKEEDENADAAYKMYLTNGPLLVQALVDNLILRSATGVSTANIQSRFVKMPTQKYSDSGLYSNTNSGQIDIYIIFPLLVFYLGFIFHMLKEKERKITENLRNMGMSLLPHYLAWYAWYLLVLFVTSLIWAVIVSLTFFRNSNFILVWLLFFLTGTTLLSLAFIICSFFVTAKPGVLFGIISFFVLYAVNIGRTSIDVPTEGRYAGFAISPFSALSMAGANMTLLESLNNFGFGFENIAVLINYFRYTTFIIVTVIETIVFFLIGIYLDQVWPTEIGIKKHPLFCLGMKRKVNEVDDAYGENRASVDDKDYALKNYEPVPRDILEQAENNSINIKNLRKVYSNGKVAVHNLSLDMFSNQIFALLGHNGAGKTTTISMISGLLTQSSGTIDICGYDTKTQYDEVKKILGVCPQLNPIYDSLTCREHLELYGNIKLQGARKVTDEEIDQILTDIDLIDKKNYTAGKLSGGQKRKLCIGIAFIGGSKVILLDEPTSGMDTFARRYLWEMIKKYKKDRIIILCTHYMDEADFLGDRFGIMGEGRLITSGSSLFLKKRFGVGYDLTIVKQSSEMSTETIEKVIRHHVPSYEKTGDISMEVKYRLPNESSASFERLFRDLEENKVRYGIQSFGISLTTLEEVFLKVAVGMHEKENKNHNKNDLALKIQDSEVNFELEDIRIKNTFSIFTIHFWALCKKRLIYFKRDLKSVFCEIVLPILIISFGLLFTLVKFIKDPAAKDWTPKEYFPKDAKVWVNSPAANAATYSSVYDRISGVEKYSIDRRIDTSSAADFEQQLLRTKVNERYSSYFVNTIDNTNKVYNYITFYNTTVPTSAIIAANQFNTAVLKSALNTNDAYIKVRYEGLKLSNQTKSFENTADGFIAVFIFALAYAFIPGGVILFVVKERENNSKHQQIVSGVSIYAYWLSNLLVDVLKYAIPGIYCALSCLIFGIDAFTEGDRYSAVWALVILYGPAIMAFTYATSFLFKNAESAQIATFVFNFLAGFILMLLSFVLRAVSSTRQTAPYFPELLLRIFPTFDFAWGMFGIANATVWQLMYKLSSRPKAWSRWGALIDVIYLLILPFVYMGIVFYIELRGHKVESDTKTATELLDLTAGDEDVKAERAEVLANQDYAIRVVDFAKEYKMVAKQQGFCKGKLISKKIAVKGVTFGVRRGECFGLLGTNGAGKTTTFKALSGEIVPSYGLTQIAGYDLSKDMNKVRYLIGYCPQFDALLDNLTAREHLELYAAIKGIPTNMRERLVQEKLEQLNLKQFENVQAGTYSGGNKRKLSVAIALLGNPPIILLDEPSSGMDPEARRFMWSIVGKISTEKKHSSVVLTTHSMEEAEALSTKLAIMVEGSIECIGPVQKLKNKYGKGFEIEVKIADVTSEEMIALKNQIGFMPGQYLAIEDCFQVMDKIGLTHLRPEIREGGRLESIHSQLQQSGKVSQEVFLNVAILHMRVRSLEAFLQHHFGQSRLIESVNSFFRYQLPEGLKISQLFGELERNVVISLTKQHQLKLAQYSVKQTTIEQIFINFANQRNVRGDD